MSNLPKSKTTKQLQNLNLQLVPEVKIVKMSNRNLLQDKVVEDSQKVGTSHGISTTQLLKDKNLRPSSAISNVRVTTPRQLGSSRYSRPPTPRSSVTRPKSAFSTILPDFSLNLDNKTEILNQALHRQDISETDHLQQMQKYKKWLNQMNSDDNLKLIEFKKSLKNQGRIWESSDFGWKRNSSRNSNRSKSAKFRTSETVPQAYIFHKRRNSLDQKIKNDKLHKSELDQQVRQQKTKNLKMKKIEEVNAKQEAKQIKLSFLNAEMENFSNFKNMQKRNQKNYQKQMLEEKNPPEIEKSFPDSHYIGQTLEEDKIKQKQTRHRNVTEFSQINYEKFQKENMEKHVNELKNKELERKMLQRLERERVNDGINEFKRFESRNKKTQNVLMKQMDFKIWEV